MHKISGVRDPAGRLPLLSPGSFPRQPASPGVLAPPLITNLR